MALSDAFDRLQIVRTESRRAALCIACTGVDLNPAVRKSLSVVADDHDGTDRLVVVALIYADVMRTESRRTALCIALH